MQALSLTALAFFLLSSTVVGIRLLCLARRTRQTPELAIGLAFLLGGVLGYVPIVLASAEGLVAPAAAPAMLVLGILSLDLGAACLWWFSWRVFRSAGHLGRVVFAAALATLAVSLVGEAASGGFDRATLSHSAWYWLGFGARTSAFAWCFVESFLYFGRMQRRVRVGLAREVDAHVFFLWSLTTAAVLSMFLLRAIAAGSQGTLPPLVVLAQAVLGLMAGALIWITFFPPRWYLRRYEST